MLREINLFFPLQGKENSVAKRERHLNVKSGSPPITRCETSPSPCASNNLFSETKQQDDLNSEIVNLSADCLSASSNFLIQDQSNLEQNYHDARQFPVPLEPKSLVFYDCEEYYLDTTKNLASDLKETHSDHLVVHNFSEEIAESFPKLESVNSLKSSINATSNLVSSVVSKNNLPEINDSFSDKVDTEKSVVNTESSKAVQQNLEYPNKIIQNLHSSAKIETETSEKSVESAFEKHISYNLDNKTVEVIEQKNSCKLNTDDLKDNIVENLNNENHLELPLLSNQEEESVKRVELPLNYKEDCKAEDKPSSRPSGKKTKNSQSKGSRNKQQSNKNKFKGEIGQSNSSKAVKEYFTSESSPDKNSAPSDSNNSSCKESEGNPGSNTTEVCFTTEYSDGTNKIELAENIEEKSISGTSDQHTEIFTCNQIVECSIENKAGELENNSAIKCESLKTEIVPINNSKYSNNSEKSGEPNHIDTKENILELCENFQTQSEHTLSNKTGHFKTQSDSDQVRKCEHFQDHCEKNSKSEGEKVQIEEVICFLSSETHSVNESDNNLENQNKLSPENISYVSESSETCKSENSSNLESRPLNKGDIGIDHKVTFENNSNSSFNSNCINKLTPSDSNTSQTPQITTDRGTERDEGIYPLSISCYGNEEFEILGNEANKLAEELTDVEKPVELEYDSLNFQAMADECSKNLKSISLEGHSNAKVDKAFMKRESLSLQIGDTEAGPEIATGLTSNDLKCASEFFREAAELESQIRRNIASSVGNYTDFSIDSDRRSYTSENDIDHGISKSGLASPPHEERSAPEGTSSPDPKSLEDSEMRRGLSRSPNSVMSPEVNELLKKQALEFEEKLLRQGIVAAEKEKELHEMLKEEQNQMQKVTSSRDALLKLVEQYKGMLGALLAEKEKSSKGQDEKIKTLEEEKQQALEDLANVEAAFSDVHRKYERTKQIVDTLRRNEETLRTAVKDLEENLVKQEKKFTELQKHAEEKVQLANEEFEALRRSNDQEMTKMAALLKKAEMKIISLQESLERKNRENQELTQLCDDLISKVGS